MLAQIDAGALRRQPAAAGQWVSAFRGRATVVACREGTESSLGVAWLRHEGVAAEQLEGGVQHWVAAGLPTIAEAKLPSRDAQGRTLGDAGAAQGRPHRPWLIRRLVDPAAVFLFVAPRPRAIALVILYRWKSKLSTPAVLAIGAAAGAVGLT